MHRRLLYAIATVVAALGMFTVAASASGPAAPPGKTLITFTCGAPLNRTVDVTEPHAFFHAVGVGQALGEQLHGIPVYGTTDVYLGDEITGSPFISEPFVTGNGNAHPDKPTTFCTGTAFAGVASDFFGTSLPSGVGATDHIIVVDNINVILKP